MSNGNLCRFGKAKKLSWTWNWVDILVKWNEKWRSFAHFSFEIEIEICLVSSSFLVKYVIWSENWIVPCQVPKIDEQALSAPSQLSHRRRLNIHVSSLFSRQRFNLHNLCAFWHVGTGVKLSWKTGMTLKFLSLARVDLHQLYYRRHKCCSTGKK